MLRSLSVVDPECSEESKEKGPLILGGGSGGDRGGKWVVGVPGRP